MSFPTEINNVVTIELMGSVCNCKSTWVFEGWGLNWIYLKQRTIKSAVVKMLFPLAAPWQQSVSLLPISQIFLVIPLTIVSWVIKRLGAGAWLTQIGGGLGGGMHYRHRQIMHMVCRGIPCSNCLCKSTNLAFTKWLVTNPAQDSVVGKKKKELAHTDTGTNPLFKIWENPT